MRFEIKAEHAPNAEPVEVEAESWFVALQDYFQRRGEALAMSQLSITIREDGVSAKACEKETGRVWEIAARLAPPDAMAYFVTQMRQSWWVLKPYGWLLALLWIGVSVGIYQLGQLAQIPPNALWVMALIGGGEAALWLWSGLACKVGVAEAVEREHWKLQTVVQRGLIAATMACGAALIAYWLGRPPAASIWWRTALWLLAFMAALYALHRAITWLLIQGEFRGYLAPGNAGRWMGRTTTAAVMLLGAVWLGLASFIGGIYWWYGGYVTEQRRQEVDQRAHHLRALQLQSLRDRNQQHLGLYTKSESDWSRYYNDPDLMGWRVSRAIQLAEGAVPPPAWWWLYLPDGKALQSEPFSLKGFLRVPYYFLKQRRKVGGSTPALQAAKNLMDFGQKRQNKGLRATIGLKLFVEIPRAYIMAQRFTPREMMATYMATLWAGRGGNYGLHRMSLYYFAEPNPGKLSWNQAAVLAASLPNPGRFNPWLLRHCRSGQCKGPRTQAIYDTWRERITQLKRKLRRRGHSVPKTLPPFCNGMGRMRILSRRWLRHDAHIRAWIRRELPDTTPLWRRSSRFDLGYDRRLTLGTQLRSKPQRTRPCAAKSTPPKTRATPKPAPVKAKSASTTKQPPRPAPRRRAAKPGNATGKDKQPQSLVAIVQGQLEEYRRYIKELQIAYTLVDARDGMITSQYGGDLHVDMAYAPKPVVGSTFKVITMLIGGHWPDRLPLLNQGNNPKKRHRKKFQYQSVVDSHMVRNSHGMPKFVYKRAALSMSANIGFVFMSLYWTWLIDEARSEDVVRIGLAQMYEDRMGLSPRAAKQRAEAAMKDRRLLLKDLRGKLGYAPYLKKWQRRALFEAGKGYAIQELLQRRRANPRSLTLFLDADSTRGFGGTIQGRWAHHRQRCAAAWKGQLDWRKISWLRPLRMELGLRYIIHLAQLVAGFDRKRDNLKPVLTMTLGVNNTGTQQLAAVAATVAAGKLVHPRLIKAMYRGRKRQYTSTQPTQPLPLPASTLPDLQKAMNGVLRWGTAARSGRIVAKEHGIAWLKRSGAKTGTVQRYKGVSCVGYLGHYAGALTISTPNNRPLIQYTLYDSLTRQHTRAAKKAEDFLACINKEEPGSWKGRYCKRKWTYWDKRATALKTRNDGYKAKAAEYLRTNKRWKRSEYNAAIYLRKAQHLAAQIRLKQRQVGIYQSYINGEIRMIQLYDKWFLRFNTQAQARLDKARAQRQAAEALLQKALQKKKETVAALEQHKRVLKTNKPQRRKRRREWRKLVRKLQQLRYTLKRARYQARIFAIRLKHATARAANAQRRLTHKSRQYRTNQRKQTNNKKRQAKWRKRKKQVERVIVGLEAKKQAALTTQREWLKQAAKEEAAYNRLEALVKRTHKRWSLYSSDACALLFRLLGHWKNQTTPPQNQKK